MRSYETEIEIGSMFLTIDIGYDAYPGEPMVMYDSNGTGYPGSPPSVEILDVVVTSVSGETYDKNRSELIDWAADLDRIAGKIVAAGDYEYDILEALGDEYDD